MKLILSSLIVVLIIGFSCKAKQKVPASNNIISELVIDGRLFKEVVIDTNAFKFVSYSIDKQFFKADVITTLNGKHSFKLIGNGMMAKSLPPKTSLKLIMETEPAKNDDTGIVIQAYSLSFDLKKLSENYQNEISVQINQLNNLIYKPIKP
jgi:hypothetical protein